ncbi:unnamed protein product (macronuclear) [Paramecium tetraurelia]|uniref:Orc1-like AAA ATPase domain-containing protein n=1 Tax=Paramecium tetraurelia TaxID=5888 RepID=A0DQY2_PARTE|nr:uncharacterized protein GSPATT00002850001 [Paramecium tetraurelia]CAK85449.1 unnamed protein product [Paramecium tetraurelia]|eukprot:XP_001452846.1 hypothetical protein (macronuclear) [Paramecium tetraurelia strain d4-2]
MLGNTQYFKKIHDAVFKLLYGQPKKLIPRTLEGPIVWPFFQRSLEIEKLKHFISYEENIFKQQVNSKNTVFVVGAKGIGKSWFLRNTCKNSIVIDNSHINFQSFFDQMRMEIIKYVSEQKLVSNQEILQIALRKYLPQYLDIYFNQYIRDQLTENVKQELKVNVSQGNQLNKLDWDTGELEFWEEDAKQIQMNSYNSLNVENSFFQLAKLIYKDDECFGCLNLMMDLIQQIEIDKIDNPIKINATIAAQQQTDFLFDILNYASGFDKSSNKKKEVSLVLLNIDKLLEYYKYDAETIDFFDHLILRTYNPYGIRNHFPLVIESSNSKFFNRDMMEMMNIELSTVLHIDISDINKEQIKIKLRNQFREEIDQIYERLGGSLQAWHQLTKQAVTNDEFELERWFESFSKLEYNKFNYLMNMTTINNEISNQLDNNHVDANIYRMMKALHYFKGNMFTGTYYADMILMENPIIHALQQENVLYHPKYVSHLHFTQKYYNQFCREYLQRRKKQIKYWPEEEKDADLFVSAFKSERKKRGEYLVQVTDEPRRHIYDDIRKEDRPYHEYYL